MDAAAALRLLVLMAACLRPGRPEYLTPPYFNLAEGRRVTATATCGEGVNEPELFCKLIGANSDVLREQDNLLIQGQVCDHCDPSNPLKTHPPEYAVDGTETWWQSPPLSRGSKYNEVNLTIDLGQEFHVAYVYIKMANSPRPGVWILEKSADNGKTYEPWQYFADTKADCVRWFGPDSLEPINKDTSVVCETQYSKIVPLENGEIFVSLLLNRPSANDFVNSTSLQEWTRATNVRFRFLRTKNLLGHLMAVERQDPSVTRRYFYSIKDISIGGRCRCNGHADSCEITDPKDAYKLLCNCQHHTCGDNCERCCPGFEQKAWSQSKANKLFVCEPCNCFGHTEHCEYNATIDRLQLSLDIHGNYEGGGVCQNCRDHTKGINCNQCEDGYYRPNGYHWNQTDVCQPCQCNDHRYTGNCEEGSGICECRVEYLAPNCDDCSYGYFGYPNCRPCECFLNGTRSYVCEAQGGQCPCKPNFGGKLCRECSPGFYGFPECLPCECNPLGMTSDICDAVSGNCSCSSNFGGRTCDRCGDGYYDFPQCKYCQCDVKGTEPGVCDKSTGACLCKPGYGGPRCDQCVAGYNGYPDCKPCGCSEVGSASKVCDASGRCPCLFNFAGKTCEQCSPGYYKYPDCLSCDCNAYGSIGLSCDNEGKCQCKPQFDGTHCEMCKEGLYNFPLCEECNCNPAGVVDSFRGCGSVPAGELCQCKPRVTGRICDTCRPLYYNLQPYNPEGCEECDCHVAGVVGNIAECNPKSGQCVCKPAVSGQRCDTCAPGTYDLRQDNIFGCTDCGCDVGGSVTKACNKETGQCICQPRITGRTCKEPLQTHYFPTLHQFLYEVEDGITPDKTPIRYKYDEDIFPGYSWKGYAVFSPIQNEVIRDDVYIVKPSLYRMVLRYVNFNNETVTGHIKITPESQSDTEQTFVVAFKPTRTPAFVTVAGPSNGIPSPLVMNPGQWAVSIKTEKNLFLDYFVLLPGAFYEAAILVNQVTTPCKVGEIHACRYFSYPNLTQYDQVQGEGAYVIDGNTRENYLDSFSLDVSEPDIAPHHKIPMLTNSQPQLLFDLRVTKPGPHMVLVSYITPRDQRASVQLEVSARTQTEQEKGSVTLQPCDYTIVCKHVALDKHGRVAIFNLDSNFVSIGLKKEGEGSVAIESVVAVPEDSWNLDYVKPKPVCVRKNGKCVQSTFYTPAEAKKIEFEEGNDAQFANNLPANIFSNTTGLIILREEDNVVDITGKVPAPGPYKFVIHYYQPDHPEFELDVILQNGQFYEAKLPVVHCPATSGCRALVRQPDGNTDFQLTENFVLTLKSPPFKKVWLDYVLILPLDTNVERVMPEEALDQTAEFISQCGKDSYYIDQHSRGFCRDAVFSITSAYNNGALPCQCDFDGSLSFECEQFGGQCPCKPNVIGRKCEACKTGYFGFPDCKSCNCPSDAVCTPTGECVCPMHVVGERCDQCEAYTYGYDSVIGCSECNCNRLGVENSLQCDLLTGVCGCKPNVVGRTCDRCQAGFWQFPYCQNCDCDLRGTTDAICDQVTAECFCKANVYGQACDLCKEGSFNIQQKTEKGCTECFCFGKTSRCTSSSLYKDQIRDGEGWKLSVANLGKVISLEDTDVSVEMISPDNLGADLTKEVFQNQTVYFSAPAAYLGKRLTSYGGALNYSIFYTPGPFGSAMGGPDVIIRGADIYLLHFALEQPAATETYPATLDLVESNFVLPSGLPTTREQMMQVLERVQGLYIRATYWEDSVTTRLMRFSLDSASDRYDPVAGFALSVEQCHCPAAYTGLSCEECADGYYRAATGPYGGFCVPCQCHGHATTCDKITGVCIDCKHNTTGEHCENCVVGYHGNATTGTPYDCLICACPLPIPSNNFATSCELSEDGDKISCQCSPGYFGARCESCAAGFYGRPEQPGDYCKPCDCSGNIDPSDPRSCDTVTGNCTNCLHNTFGGACQLCAPGYFGDAKLRDCQSCVCDRCGTQECDHATGRCQCLPNVVGEKCDRCDDKHYGFSACQGCKACDCQLASESLQCDDISGQCRCKPGVMGLNCDRCATGYWQYSAQGCVSCGCNTEYSIGASCNASTGQCECLPGVVGEKCDRCPPRWVLIPDQGCFQCETCHHALLDVTDDLHRKLAPISGEFETVAASYFTNQRLKYFNDSVVKLRPDVDALPSNKVDISPYNNKVNDIESDARGLNRKAEYKVEAAKVSGGGKLKDDAREVESLVLATVRTSQDTVREIQDLALSLETSSGPQIDHALDEAKHILEKINEVDFSNTEQEAMQGKDKAADLLDKMRAFAGPPDNMTEALESLRDRIFQVDTKLNDLLNHTQVAQDNARKVEALNAKNRNSSLTGHVNTVKYLTKDGNLTLSDSRELVKNASALLNSAKAALSDLTDQRSQLEIAKTELEQKTQDQSDGLNKVNEVVSAATTHANELTARAQQLDHLLTDTRDSADSAIKAANAYADIVTAIGNASQAAEDAIKAADDTTSKSENIVSNSNGVKEKNDELLKKIYEMEDALRAADGPSKQLEATKDDLSHVKRMNNHINNTYNQVKRGLENIPQLELTGVYDSGNLDAVTDSARRALDQINQNAADIPQKLQTVKQLHKDNQHALDNVKIANNELDKVNSILPDMIELVEQLKEKPQELKKMAETIKDDLEDLKQKVKMARDLANRIKVGATFFRNTTLELRNPDSITHQGLNSHVSVYFKTPEPNGLIIYLGNEKGTSRKMRRSNSDDFMALQLENGYPVLTIDLGSGPEQINNNKYVSDDKWYQAVVDRTGKSVQFKIREEITPEYIREHPVEHVLKGTSTLLNLDKDLSKLFVGGFPVTFDVQPSLKSSFEGHIEELVIGDSQVGLWNFEDAANLNKGSIERDKLLNVSMSTGYRFNGEGYAVIDGQTYGVKKRSDIKMSFKTFAEDGLLFLTYGKQPRNKRQAEDNHMMSIEMRGGKIIYQYYMGTEHVLLQTDRSYNDGQWHSVSAARKGLAGSLVMDNRQDEAKQYRPSSTQGEDLLVQKTFYFGGTPRDVAVEGVTNIGFDGCIDEVQVGQTSIDLSNNINVFGVSPGCPVKFAGVISFEEGARGYARWGNATARDNIVQLILKIKTTNPNGLIAYAVDGSASSSLQLVDGNIVFKSGGQEVSSSPATKYNDGHWHVIVATSQTGEPLLLDIDDYDNFKSPDTAVAMRLLYSNLYFGGVPSRVDAALALQPQFSGCIGDATLNGVVVNFANLTDTSQAIVGKCLWDEEIKPPFSIPPGRPELPISGELPGPEDIGGAVKGPEEEDDISPEEPPEEVSDSPVSVEVDRFGPPAPSTEPPTPAPTPVPNCKLPLYPATDSAVGPQSGVRFGTKFGSRVEYDPLPGRLRNKFDFSVKIKTVSTEGIILYVHDQKHIDFIALYLKDGRVHYGYNCGSGAALLESDNPVNDGEWHSIRISRTQTNGKLYIDDFLVREGESKGSTKTINVLPPVYLGGIDPKISDNTKTNLKGLNHTFEGCLKDFSLNDKPITSPSKPIGVIPCSDNVEVGAFFSPEGGYIKFSDKFRVGVEIDIKLEIKPRDLSGMLVSVHSKKDYLLLQMIDGTIRFSVDNGKGEIWAAYKPPTPHYFCDGQWHNIQAVKSKNVVSLSVDKTFVEPGIGTSSSTDTKHPLYIGGHPIKSKGLRGLLTNAQYVGCIRNLEINGRQEALNRLPTYGNVTQSVCPTI
ncbi:laminin subunit alpha [Macrosteles quadrilineatus]|uniref:laminin subunit alpha n=1 Tax=Macrosteles quadrilineatus TaxID=74068 RepID=UPI0023E27D50|nr:laminin subunit alpha [Macrosteles quadrilineatus]